MFCLLHCVLLTTGRAHPPIWSINAVEEMCRPSSGNEKCPGSCAEEQSLRWRWAILPSPTRWSALTSYHSQLVLVGGEIALTGTTNQLWVFQEGDSEQTWTQPLPAMPMACRGASAISHHNHLIVAGGQHKIMETNVVEVYDGHQWMKTDPLPECCSFMKSTIHNGTYYLLGGQSVFCASLLSLIAKSTQQSPISPSSREQKSVWERLPDVPYEYSATTVLGAALVAVGGRDRSWTSEPSVHMYILPPHSLMAPCW